MGHGLDDALRSELPSFAACDNKATLSDQTATDAELATLVRLWALEAENARLKRLLTDAELDKAALIGLLETLL